MADALPPEPAKVQLEALKAFTADLELSVRARAKGYGSRPVEVAELRAWIDAALASNTDAAMRPKEGLIDAPHLSGSANRAVLGKLLEKVRARVGELESGRVEPDENVKDWLLSQLGDAAQGKVMVPGIKSGPTRVASLDEVKEWLGAPRKKLKD